MAKILGLFKKEVLLTFTETTMTTIIVEQRCAHADPV